MQNGVAVVGHNGVAAHLDGEDLRQCQQALLDPAPAMLEGATGVSILAAQEGATDTARDTVVVGGASRLISDFRGLGMGGAPWLAVVFRPFFHDRT
jgi:hypothetical protein